MARPIKPSTIAKSECWREKIKIGNIMARLNRVAMGEEDATPEQLRAADILLKKVVPDLARSELVGKDGKDFKVEVTWQK